jgi:hypothetical protein
MSLAHRTPFDLPIGAFKELDDGTGHLVLLVLRAHSAADRRPCSGESLPHGSVDRNVNEFWELAIGKVAPSREHRSKRSWMGSGFLPP